MIDVERVLASRDLKVVLSITGKAKLKRERLDFLQKFTLWNSLFPLDFAAVFCKLVGIVEDLYRLGVHLNLPQHLLDAIEADFPHSTEKRRTELVRVWINSSPYPPCWCHLVEALKLTDYRVLAKEIEMEHSASIQLQRTLLDPEKQTSRPDEQFLELLAGMVKSECPSLASILSLTSSEMKELQKSRKQLSQSELSLQILKKWTRPRMANCITN